METFTVKKGASLHQQVEAVDEAEAAFDLSDLTLTCDLVKHPGAPTVKASCTITEIDFTEGTFWLDLDWDEVANIDVGKVYGDVRAFDSDNNLVWFSETFCVNLDQACSLAPP